MKYFLVAHKILAKLSREFGVSIPDLDADCPANLSGCYYCGEVHVNEETLRSIVRTVKTSRHEFAHYLQDLFNLEGKAELKARRFERNLFALGLLPKSQTVLVSFSEGVNEP